MIRRCAVTLLLVTSAACGGARQFIREGDKLLKAGDFRGAIAQYDEALRAEPDNEAAKKAIREARRAQVRDELSRAEAELSKGNFANALGAAMKARSLPLDLEDVDLVRRIDETLSRAAQLAEEAVAQYVGQGRHLDAVDLAKQVADATPGMEARRQWANDVSRGAAATYMKAAQELEAQGLLGAAAIQLALAKRAGGEVEVPQVMSLWGRFAEPTCFAEPSVQVQDKSGKAGELVEALRTTAHAELAALRARCGAGTRPLGVVIQLDKLETVDKSEASRAAKPLPGADVKTEEEYFEEIPRTVTEEVTEMETRIDQVEKRDCAPRPGQGRGCRTWTEEVETKVPVKKLKEVVKVERVRKTRPIKTALPEDKVVSYEVTTVTRRVTAEGFVQVAGFKAPRKFAIRAESQDSTNKEAAKPGLTVPADPLEVKSMAEVQQQAAAELAEAVRRSVAEAVEQWSADYQKEAQRAFRDGQLPLAEEQYLKLMALGAGVDATMARFFAQRYGRPVGAVMDMLVVAMGRAPANRPVGGAATAGNQEARFPMARESGAAAEESTVQNTPAAPAAKEAPATTPEAPKRKPAMSEDEIRALEEESIEATAPKPKPPVAPQPGQVVGEQGAPAPAPAPATGGSTESGAPQG